LQIKLVLIYMIVKQNLVLADKNLL